MKVALVILHSDPARGGAERYTADLASALSRRGHEVAFVAATGSDSIQDVPVRVLSAPGPTRLRRYNAFLDSLDAHLADESYDIVHAMLPVRTCDLYHPHAGLAAEAIQTGHLKHASPVKRHVARVANRLNLKRLRFGAVEHDLLVNPRPPIVICLSEYVKQTVRRHFGMLPEDRLATLFNAVDLNRFDPNRVAGAGQELRRRFNIGAAKQVALIIAQDFERKGLREAIEAVAMLRDPRLVLLVVGKPSPEKYIALAERLNVRDRVVFAGPTPDPYPFYAAADLFVLPTRHDPCSLVVLEALAMGLPVVSTKFNGACEIMRTGEHGYVLNDPGDVHSLATAIGRIIRDSDVHARFTAACLRLRPALAYDVHLDAVDRLYHQAAASKRA